MARGTKTQETPSTDVFEELRSASDNDVSTEIKTKTPIDRNRLVPVMNSTIGMLVYTSSKTGAEWRFNEYGDTDDIEFSELLTMRNAYSKFLNQPWLLILDEEVSDYLGLKNLYKTVLNPNEVDRLFNLPAAKMEKILPSLPNGMKILVIQKANEMIASGQLDSLAKRRLIESTYNITLNNE